MGKIRAYKLAEELGIDKQELVDQAAEFDIELKSAMSALEDEQADLLREKLGKPAKTARDMEESRVEGKRGTTVLRRRKRATVVEPPAEEAPPLEAVPQPIAPVVGEVAAEPQVEPEPEVAAEVEESVAEPEETPSEQAVTAERRPAAEQKPEPAQPAADRKGRQRKRVREVVNLQEQEQFARQITGRGNTSRRVIPVAPRQAVNPRRKRRDKLAVPAVARAASEQKRAVKVEGEISVGELAKLVGAKAPVIQGKLMALGIMVSVNQTVNIETCQKLAAELGFEVQDIGFKEEEFLEPAASPAELAAGETAGAENLQPRAPVITVMGHVDHGKTSLLDQIRKTRVKVVDGEAGGITQHIGAYQVEVSNHDLTFIDTPGHAAFTAMRARGAAVTDMVVLVVAANDGVMPQTVEAIEHAQAAGCPIVVAINKIDLDDADSKKTRQRLTEHNLVPEDFGGDVICVDVSAKTGDGIDQLLEMLALQAEVLELRADPTRRARGVVLEAHLDRGRGPVATVLIQDGTLARGDTMVVDTESGRARLLEDASGARVDKAGPSAPVQVIGLSGVPRAGAPFYAVESERVAKQITSHREDQARSRPAQTPPRLTLEEFFAQAEGEGPKELSVVLKADVQGTCEAVRDSLEKLSTDEVKLKVLSSGVGAVNESDVMLAAASKAVVIAFHVRPDPSARRAADVIGVDVRTYTVIMDLIDEVKSAMAGLLPPTIKEHLVGRAEVRQTFAIPKIGTVAGSLVMEGKVLRSAQCRLVRDGVQLYQGAVGSLRRFKEEAKEVQNGLECGIGIENYNDVKVGDVIEVFEVEEVPATL